jgi:hypothetical protein
MAKGKKINEGTNLIPFNSKVRPETKELCDAIVKITSMEGTRALIEDMLDLYEREHPDVIEAAREYIKATKRLTIYSAK